MTELLSKIFVKDRENVTDPAVRSRYGAMAGIVCIVLNSLLATGKLIAGLFTGSIAIQADALNNFSDAGASVISLVSFRLASKPPDRDHPFGHARIEYIASMIVSFMILLIGFELLRESIGKIVEPSATEFSVLSVIILSVSILGKLWMYLFNRKIGEKINSDVMRATAADSLSDVVATSAVLATTLVLHFTGFDADAYVGIAVAVFIFVSGIKILNETKNSLLGSAPVDTQVAAIKKIIAEYPEALGIHDMIVHSYGPGHTFATLHIEVDGSHDVFETHDVIDNIEKRIENELSIVCSIHLDPIVTDDEQITALFAEVKEKACEISPDITVHDFRFVKGVTHSNLIFDIVLPFESALTPDEAKARMCQKIKEIDESYEAVITVDRG